MSLAVAQQVHGRNFFVSAFTTKLTTDTPSVPLNDPVVVKITTTNTSKESLYLPVEPLVWIVRLEGAKAAADTAEGMRRKHARHGSQTAVVSPLIKAGASITTEETIAAPAATPLTKHPVLLGALLYAQAPNIVVRPSIPVVPSTGMPSLFSGLLDLLQRSDVPNCR